ncbi:MAG: hypothetical protein ACRELD_02810 [Longimicrobiales bacterium]
MAVPIPLIPLGARVRVRPATLPLDPAYIGRAGTVIGASEYRPSRCDVALDGTGEIVQFSAAELDVLDAPVLLPPERRAAGRRRALP